MNRERRESTDVNYGAMSAWLSVILSTGIIAVFHETAWSMVLTWYRSETYAHGFIIAPISLWLIWQKRHTLRKLRPVPEFRVLILLLGVGFIWLIGYLINALVFMQLALVSMIILSLWMILGNRIAWVLAFPLAYLIFAVPMGEDLVPALMEITASATVYLIKLSGIPVFREGLYFSLPSGNWSVVEACSGIRYLIASLTLGTLFAYISYSSIKKRLIFIIFAIIVPIVANSLRAYMIVMLGHLSDMKLATGVDHLIYGWIFFGVVMLILFTIGSKWQDKGVHSGSLSSDLEGCSCIKNESKKHAIYALFLAVFSVSIWPVLGNAMMHRGQSLVSEAFVLPVSLGEWKASFEPLDAWQPEFPGADRLLNMKYQHRDKSIGVSVGYYAKQEFGRELINSQNILLGISHKEWKVIGPSKVGIYYHNKPFQVDQLMFKGKGKTYRVYTWYRIGEHATASEYKGKLLEAYNHLTFGRQDSARIVLILPYESERESDIKDAQRFLDMVIPAIETSLDLLASN